MTLFDCNFFRLFLDDRIRCTWNGEQPEYLNLVINDTALAHLFLSTGLYADKRVIENSIIQAVASRGGYVTPMDEDYPDELTLLIEDQRVRMCQHHLLRYGEGWAIHIALYDKYMDNDIEALRAVLSTLEIKVDSVVAAGDNSAHHLEISDATFYSAVGLQRILEIERHDH